MTRHSARKHTLNIVGHYLAITLLAAITVQAQPHGTTGLHRKKAGSTAPNSGSVSFAPAVTYAAVSAMGSASPGSLAVADVNGDGNPDLIVANSPGYSSGSIGVLLGNGDGTFQPVKLDSIAGTVGVVNALAVADVNGDGKADVLVGTCCESNGNNEVAVLLGNGDGTFQPAAMYDAAGTQGGIVSVGDVNGDGRPDIVMVNWDNSDNKSTVSVLLGNGDGTFRPVVISDAPSDPSCSALADVNHDGKLDLVICSEDTVAVLLGNGDGTFQTFANTNFYAGYCLPAVAVGDVNGDGLLDMVAPNAGPDGCGSQGFAGILKGDGDGTFQGEVNYLALGYTNGGVGQVAVGDLDGDGKLDVMVTTGEQIFGSVHGSIGVLLGNGDGSFQTATSFDAGGSQTNAVVAADLNHDGKPDIIVANYGSGTIGVLLNNAGVAQTATALTSSLNPSVSGQSVTFTAQVTSSSCTPTGTVNFYDGATLLGSATLASGSASFSTSLLTAGSHSITATYQGSSSFASSTSAALIQVVNSGPASTSTSLTSSGNPCLKPCGVTFTAIVTSAAGTPTGTVSFSDDEPRFLGTATLSGGVASIAPGGFHHGTWQITATYNGSSDFAPSTSPVLDQVVYELPVPTQTSVSTSGSPSFIGQPVTFSAGVSPTRGSVPDGETLNFYDGHAPIGSVPMSNQRASLTTSSLAMGKQSILVTYNGDGLYESSHGMVVQVVVKYSTTTTLVSSVNPSVSGQPVTMTVTVTSSGPTPTGEVMLKGFGTLTLVGGTASATKSNFTVGSHPLTAKYKGDDLSAASTSEVLVQVVDP